MNKTFLKSVGAVLAGFFVIVVLSISADTILKIIGILPWDHLYVSNGLIFFVIFYRSVFSVAGCYLAARMAPGNAIKHAIALGILGVIVSSAGTIAASDLGPDWYGWTLAGLALPLAWLGGKLYEKRNEFESNSEYTIKE